MGALYAYSLAPVLAVSALLFFTAVFRGPTTRGLALYCLSVAIWSGALLLTCLPATSALGERLVASGALIAAGYLHVAFDVTEQRSRRLVTFAWAVALAISALGAVRPGALYGPLALERGPLFWPAMALSVGAAIVPSWFLWSAYRSAGADRRPILRRLFAAGVLCATGGMGNALLLSSGVALPFGMILVLASLLILGDVIRSHEPPAERRLFERSLLYAALTAFLSAGFLLGVLSLMNSAAEPLLAEYKLGAFFLLALSALAVEPLRQQLQQFLGRRLVRGGAGATELAHALEAQEEKAERAERLAEVGTLVSAVAHEVRNPLGVLSAHLAMLERADAPPDTVEAMREQIDRASRFVDDLLRFGRPQPLQLRSVDVRATLELSLSTAIQGLGTPAPEHEVEWAISQQVGEVQADQAQLTQLFVILFDNALLALLDEAQSPRRLKVSARSHEDSGSTGDRVMIGVEDSGPGLPEALVPNLFQPFVTGRKREGPRPGTGLGLATARRIVERHGGSIDAGRSDLGGASFSIVVPRYP